jgi:PadR family transcriptional regulator PadR
MKNEELLTYRWQESTSGPPRKYYALTEEGQELLTQLHEEWKAIQKAVDTINID